MNPVLAQLYGTGFEKQASDDDIDLTQISGAQLLELLALEEQEKVAHDDEIDFSQFSGRELLELYAEAEEQEAYDVQGATLEKMASTGELEYWDMVGRIQAHAYADEMNKLASYDDDDIIEVNLDEIDGETMMALMDEGYEFIEDDFEKEASLAARKTMLAELHRRAAQKGLSGGAKKRWIRESWKRMTSGQSAIPARQGRGAAAASQARAAERAANQGSMPFGARSAATRAGMVGRDAPRYAKMRGQQGVDWVRANPRKAALIAGGVMGGTGLAGTAAAGTAAAGAAGAAGLAGAAGGAYYMKKKKKGPWAKGGRFNR
jgi:hypothetical protein